MSHSPAPTLSTSLNAKLSGMMFLQYAIWGAWLPLLWPYLAGHVGMQGDQIANIFAVGAIGAIVAPFIAGQIADRYFNTEKFLGLSHILGAVLVFQLASITSYTGFLVFSLVYSLVYSPTLSLTNSLAFHHLPDRDRDFGRVRVWGTVGWIAVGIGIGQWLLSSHTISDDEARDQVFATQFADDEARSKNLNWIEVAPKEGASKQGRLISDAGPVVIEIPAAGEGEEPEQLTFEAEVVKSTTPLWQMLAPADEEGTRDAAALAKVESALRAMETEGSDGDAVKATLLADDFAFSAAAHNAPIAAGHAKGMADAFRLSALLGLLMGLFCFLLPKTPPSKSEGESNAAFAALGEVKRQPLLTLFLLAVPVSCIHQFYFVHTAGFLGGYQLGAADSLNKIFGVGGGGLMTIGQMAEIGVLGLIPFFAKSLSRKALLGIGLGAYAMRMFLFAYVDSLPLPPIVTLMLGVALHGLCFGCFIFVAFMVVDEESAVDLRASAQSLFNLVIIGIGIIVGSKVAGWVAEKATTNEVLDYTKLFSFPMYASIACLVLLLLFYPSGRPKEAS